MAITAAERTQIIELTTLMFNAAPGAFYLTQIVAVYESNGRSLQTLANVLGSTGVYQSLNPNFQTATEFAADLLATVGLTGDAFATDFIVARFNAGQSKASIVFQAFSALNGVGTSDAARYQAAKTDLLNKTAVAEYYSVTKEGAATDLATLQTVIGAVTADPASVTAAEAQIDQLVITGGVFTLTTGVDTLVGTSGNDTFNALPGALNAPTFTALDSVDGGAGTGDTLNITTIGALDLSTAAGAVVKNVEVANLVSSAAIVGGDVSGVIGLLTVNASSVTGTSVTAALTTNVVASALGGDTSVTGGLAVTASAAAGNVIVDKSAGTVTATASAGAVTIGAGGAVGGAVAASATGSISVAGGTSLNLTTIGGVSTAQEGVNVAAAATAAAAEATALALVVTDVAAKAAADVVVAALATLVTAINAATIQGDVDAAVAAAGASLTASQGVTLRTAFAAGLTTSLAAAKAAALAVETTFAAAAAAADATAAAKIVTDTAAAAVATAASDAADKVVTDGIQANATAIVNTKLASGAVNGSDVVAITDGSVASNTLTTVTLNGAGVSTLTGGALTSVSLANTLSDVTIANATAGHTQTLTLNKVTGGIIKDAAATTLNVVTTGAASKALTLDAGAATILNVSGTQGLTATIAAGLVKAANITTSGAFSASLTGLDAAAIIDASSSTGANTVTLGSGQTYAGGSGVDKVTITAGPTVGQIGGAGTADELVLNLAGAFDASANTKLGGFEILALGAAATGLYSATGFTGLHVGNAITGASSFTNVAAGVGLTVDAALGANTVSYVLKDATSLTSDAMALTVGNATTKGIIAGTVDTTGVELVTINSLGTGATGTTNTVSVTNAGALALTVTGGEALTVTGFAGSTLKTIDLSAATKAIDVSGVTVSATGVTATAGAGGAKITGGAGVDHINGGAGGDTLLGAGGADVIVGGGGKDVITGGTGADLITISGSTTQVKYLAGDSGANLTTNTQVSELTTGFDVVTGAVAGDTINLGTIMGSVATGYDFGAVKVGAANLAGVTDHIEFASGTFDAAAGTFSFAANGADTAVTYDTSILGDGTSFESIILVGFHAGANTSAALGVITLA